jgi:release factor glutamine methyltransferase
VALHFGDATDPATLAVLDGRADLVVANPPYIPYFTLLPRDVMDHEPEMALWGGDPDGLDLPLKFLARAAALLAPGGAVVMEHHPPQAARLRGAAESLGLVQPETHPDLTGRDRFLVAHRG